MIDALVARDDQKRYVSSLRAARDHGQRPTAMILHNPYALHDGWWYPYLYREQWKPDATSESWTEWDYLLADVYQVIDDFTSKESGQFLPYDASGDVFWDYKLQYSGYLEATERYQKDHELAPGERVYAVPVFDDKKPRPTLDSWAKDQAEEKADRRPSARRDARPPSLVELKKLRAKKAQVSDS